MDQLVRIQYIVLLTGLFARGNPLDLDVTLGVHILENASFSIAVPFENLARPVCITSFANIDLICSPRKEDSGLYNMKSRHFVVTSRDLLIFIVLSYATSVSLFIDVDAGNRNYLVLFAATTGGLLFITFGVALHRQVLWALVLFWLMGISCVATGGFSELDSLALTVVFAAGYFAIAHLLDRVPNKRVLVQDMMRWIIYAFAILSVVQMATSLVGLPVPNVILTKGLWSYNSFAMEPSWLGRTVGASYLCYLMLLRFPTPSGHPVDLPLRHLKVLAAFLTTMLLSGSALAAVAILMVYLLSRSLVMGIMLVSLFILLQPTAMLIGFEPLDRVVLLASNLSSLDVNTLTEADHSGSLRVISTVIYLSDFQYEEMGFWFGYGDVGLRRFFLGRIPGLLDSFSAGFVPGFAVVYGVILTAFFAWVFAVSQTNRASAPLVIFWLVFMINTAWNTQVFWYGLILIKITYVASRENTQRVSLKRNENPDISL